MCRCKRFWSLWLMSWFYNDVSTQSQACHSNSPLWLGKHSYTCNINTFPIDTLPHLHSRRRRWSTMKAPCLWWLVLLETSDDMIFGGLVCVVPSVLRVASSSLPTSSRGPNRLGMTLWGPCAKSQTTFCLIPRMVLSELSLQTWLRICATRLFPSHLQRLSMSASQFGTDTPQDAVINPKDGIVAGFTAGNPGRLWKFMTGHLQNLKSPISKPYFDQIEYVKVPAFWSAILNPYQLQHALAGVIEKWVNRAWSRSLEKNFLQSSTRSLTPRSLTPRSLTPTFSTLQSSFQMDQPMLSQSSAMWPECCSLWSVNQTCSNFKDNLMWDPQCQSWHLMIAMVPQSKNTPPIFYHVTWKADNYGKWRTLNSPPHTALFKDLRSRNPMSETLHIQLHGSDFAKLPLSAKLRWLIEFPPEWVWFLSWFPGQVPKHFKEHSRVPSSTAASSTSLTTPGYQRCSRWLQEQRARHPQRRLPTSSFRTTHVNDDFQLTSSHKGTSIRFHICVIANTNCTAANALLADSLHEFLAQEVERFLWRSPWKSAWLSLGKEHHLLVPQNWETREITCGLRSEALRIAQKRGPCSSKGLGRS